MNKKAQSQIITTVLIILLVLAAIVIVWQVVASTIESGSETIEGTASCIGLSVKITNIDATSITVQRGAGGTTDDVDVTVVIDGTTQTTKILDLGPLETGSLSSLTILDTDKVEVAAFVGEVQCDISDTQTGFGTY